MQKNTILEYLLFRGYDELIKSKGIEMVTKDQILAFCKDMRYGM